MAAWVREWAATDLAADCAAVLAPTLVITGEPDLDQVVPTSSSLEYLDRVRGARHALFAGTGHVGIVSKPDAFAAAVHLFATGSEVPPVITIPQ
jgi:pimeloyl-ACP methyl ester carboxylesterase